MFKKMVFKGFKPGVEAHAFEACLIYIVSSGTVRAT